MCFAGPGMGVPEFSRDNKSTKSVSGENKSVLCFVSRTKCNFLLKQVMFVISYQSPSPPLIPKMSQGTVLQR